MKSPLAQETIEPTEAAVIQTIVAAMLEDQRASHKAGTVKRRDVHSKSHGTFVGAELFPRLKAGFFLYQMF
jgi:hypothetical protein